MDFHQLRIFTAVYRLKSFTGASRELGISQPTISEHIKNLEASLSCRLFDRLGRTIMPTTQADLLFPRAQLLLDSVSTLEEELTGSLDRISGKIVLGTSSVPGTYLIPAMAVEFKNDHPKVTFEVLINDTASIIDMVSDHRIFCGIVGARLDSEQLEFLPLIRDELIMASAPKLALPEKIGPDRLSGLPFLFREKGSGTRKCMENHFKAAGIDPEALNSVATLGSNAAVKEAVRQGLGVTVLSRLAVANELANGTIRQIKIEGLAMSRDFYLIRHKQRTMSARYLAFFQHLQKRLSR